MEGECWGIFRIFVKKGMENKGILSQLKALLMGKRRMRLSEYLSEYRSRNLAERRGNSFDSMVGNMEHHLRQCLGSGFATLSVKEIDTALCKRFANYLKRAVKNTGEPLSQVSAHHYFTAFRTMLGEAVDDGLLNALAQYCAGAHFLTHRSH